MLAIERRREILDRLRLNGKVIVSELAKDFDVTEETIRRDLERLDRDGLASKTYGGAVARQNSALDLPYNIRENVNVTQKQVISDQVARLIRDGERLMLDSSSTALYILRKLKDKKKSNDYYQFGKDIDRAGGQIRLDCAFHGRDSEAGGTFSKRFIGGKDDPFVSCGYGDLLLQGIRYRVGRDRFQRTRQFD